jgi:hypothetical protein
MNQADVLFVVIAERRAFLAESCLVLTMGLRASRMTLSEKS